MTLFCAFFLCFFNSISGVALAQGVGQSTPLNGAAGAASAIGGILDEHSMRKSKKGGNVAFGSCVLVDKSGIEIPCPSLKFILESGAGKAVSIVSSTSEGGIAVQLPDNDVYRLRSKSDQLVLTPVKEVSIRLGERFSLRLTSAHPQP